MKQTENTTDIDNAIAQAYQIGKRYGINCAGWYLQGTFNNNKHHKPIAENIMRMLNDCDAMFWNNVELPNLSGEFQDGMTPISLYSELCYDYKLYVLEEEDFENYDDYPVDDCLLGKFCEQFEIGVADGFNDTVVDYCQSIIDNN